MRLRRSRFPDLPDEVKEEILVKLPAKALLRFKSVSKGWYTLISSSPFANKHFRNQSNTTYPLICWTGHESAEPDYVPYFSVSLYPTEEPETGVKLTREEFNDTVTAMCGPCEGIVCVCFLSQELCLYNPTTRKTWPVRFDTKPATHATFSFWMDPSTKEFKVFVVDDLENGDDIKQVFRVYSSANDLWKHFRGEVALIHNDEYVPSDQCFSYSVSKGFYYFIKVREATSDFGLIAFDICNDMFKEVLMPKESYGHKIRLGLCDDSLALFAIERVKRRCIGIWLMNDEGGWTTLFDSAQLDLIGNPLGLWKSTELFELSYHNELGVHDTVSCKKQFELDTYSLSDVKFYALCYKESLISPSKSTRRGNRRRLKAIHTNSS